MPRLDYERVIEQPELAYATEGSAAFDLRGYFTDALKELVLDSEIEEGTRYSKALEGQFWLEKGTTVVLRTGLKFGIPKGYVLKVYPRSGLGFKHDVTLVNNVGIIDSDYTDEVLIKLIAQTEDYLVVDGNRVAQAILERAEETILVPVKEVKQTGRGGFGHSGVL